MLIFQWNLNFWFLWIAMHSFIWIKCGVDSNVWQSEFWDNLGWGHALIACSWLFSVRYAWIPTLFFVTFNFFTKLSKVSFQYKLNSLKILLFSKNHNPIIQSKQTTVNCYLKCHALHNQFQLQASSKFYNFITPQWPRSLSKIKTTQLTQQQAQINFNCR